MYKNYKKILENKNNIIHVYYFKNYYKKCKYKSFNIILNDILKNVEKEIYINNYNTRYVILYPQSLKEKIDIMYIKGNSKFIYIDEYNKSIINHLLY